MRVRHHLEARTDEVISNTHTTAEEMNHTFMKPRMTRINSKGSLHRLKHQKELLWKRKCGQMFKNLWLELTALCCRSI